MENPNFTYYGGSGENSTADLPQDTDEMVLGYRPRDLTVVHSLLALLGLLGVVGNVLSIIIWTRPRLKSSSALLLTALAVSDLLIALCLNTLQYLGTLLFTYHNPTLVYVENIVWPHVIFWLFPVGFIAQTASPYLTLTVTLERYIAVCHPFEFQWAHAYSRACKSAAAVGLFSIFYNLSRFWEKEVRPVLNGDGNVTSYRYESTALFLSPLYQSLYMNWLYLFFNHLLPLAGVVVFNAAICRKLKEAQNERQTLTDLEKRENRLTMMLVYVVVEFLLCSSVTTFFALAYIVIDVGGFVVDAELMEQMVPLDELLYTFNASFNFVTYVTLGGPFRTEFLRLFGFRKSVIESESQTSTGTQKINLESLSPDQTSHVSSGQDSQAESSTNAHDVLLS